MPAGAGGEAGGAALRLDAACLGGEARHALQHGRLEEDVRLAEGLPRLSAAVEVNAYRIVLEAWNNAVRKDHSWKTPRKPAIPWP